MKKKFKSIQEVRVQIDKIDEDLQNQYWNIFSPNNLRSKNFRMGNYFLHKNKSLL